MVIKIIKEFLTIKGLLTTTFLILLFWAAYTDVRERRIPDSICGCILLLALVNMIFPGGPGILEGIFGAFAVGAPLFFIAYVLPGTFGGGDIKFMAACGVFLGSKDIFYAFFYALVSGSIYAGYLILIKNKSRKTEFAFGPFLVIGIVIRLIFHVFYS